MGGTDDGRPVCPPQHQRHHEQAQNSNQYGSITTEDGFYMSPASSTTALSVPVTTGAGLEGAVAQQPHCRHESVGAAGSVATEQDSLLGERLVATDNEEETPENSTNDLATLGMLDAGRGRRGWGDSKSGQSSTPSSMSSSKYFSGAFGDRLLNLRICRPGAHITRFMMLTVIAVCIFIVAWVFFAPFTKKPVSGTAGGASIPGSHHTVPVPFPNIDRAVFGDPASCIVDRKLFDPSLLHPRSNRKHTPIETASAAAAERSGSNISSSGPFLKVPFPTGAFWTNLVLPPTANLNTSFPIVAYPFAFTWSPSTLQVSYPALRRHMDVISVRDTFEPDVTFGLAEEVLQRHITRFDPLSVTLRFRTSSSPAFAETYLVQGSPYVTFKYDSVTPVLTALSTFRDVVCPRDDAGNIREESSGDKVRDSSSQQRQQSQQDGVNESEEDASKAADRSDKQGRRRRQASQTERRTKWGVCTITSGGKSNDGTSVTTTVLHGVQFLLQTAENLTWMVFASEPIVFSFDKVSRRRVTSVGKYTGVLRLALIPPVIENSGKTTNSGELTTEEPVVRDNVPLATSSGVRRLIYHSGVYPVGGEVTWASRPAVGAPIFPLSNRKSIVADDGSAGMSVGNTELGNAQDKIATIKFQYTTRTMTDDSNSNPNALRDDLLLLALPHHVHSLPPDELLNSEHFDVVYQCIKGAMTPVVGDTWFLDENLTSTGFDAVVPTSLASDSNKNEQGVDARVRDVILENVERDLNGVLPTKEENVYGFGKQVARMAQLAHIASRMSSLTKRKKTRHEGGDDDNSIKVAKNAAKALHKYLTELLDNDRKDLLLFDQNLGGIVTKDGLVNSEADFGNGRYNDHHFHYGYILYACAVMGKLNSTFVAEYGRHVDALLFDVAYNKNSNSEIGVEGAFFPMARHKSWFDGHSFASGLFKTATGKSQESSSEAVNCYYGAYLWSMVRWGNAGEGDEATLRVDFARLLLATEIRGAKTYWHMTPPGSKVEGRASATSSVYNPTLSKNYMIGVVGMLDATCSTWFGSSNLYVHMINFLPVTAITAELFDKPYVQVEFSEVMQPMLPNVEPAWRGYVICDHAILDPAAAWNEALELESYELDAAISKSQILYWISTRPDFVMPRQNFPAPSPITPVENTSKQPSLMSHLCEKHPACTKLGLIGSCCPTLDGIYLGCCGQNR